MGRRSRRIRIEWRRGEALLGLLATLLQGLQQIHSFLTLQFQLAQGFDERSLGLGHRAVRGGVAAGIVVVNMVERGLPRPQSFFLVVLHAQKVSRLVFIGRKAKAGVRTWPSKYTAVEQARKASS